MMAFAAATFAGKPEFGAFADAGAVASGIGKYAGRAAGVMFALALIDACIIGASAVSLSTAYALGDVFSIRHSLHRKPSDAKGFYAVYCGLIVVSAGLVLTPGAPLGLLTNAVQTLAGVLLPSATVFLLLLCNDKAVLGPWPIRAGSTSSPARDRAAGDAVDHSDSLGAVPGRHQRDRDFWDSRWGRRTRRGGRLGDELGQEGRRQGTRLRQR